MQWLPVKLDAPPTGPQNSTGLKQRKTLLNCKKLIADSTSLPHPMWGQGRGLYKILTVIASIHWKTNTDPVRTDQSWQRVDQVNFVLKTQGNWVMLSIFLWYMRCSGCVLQNIVHWWKMSVKFNFYYHFGSCKKKN